MYNETIGLVYSTVRPMKNIIIFSLAILITSCADNEYVQSEESKKIWELLKAEEFKSIDFSKYGGEAWTRICFLGPYNENSEKALGFPWRVADHTDILKSDGHNVIIFATEDHVVEYVVQSRGYGDFWKLSGKCFSRDSAKFVKDKESGNWQNYVQEKAKKR